jgi:hypothetical protein
MDWEVTKEYLNTIYIPPIWTKHGFILALLNKPGKDTLWRKLLAVYRECKEELKHKGTND